MCIVTILTGTTTNTSVAMITSVIHSIGFRNEISISISTTVVDPRIAVIMTITRLNIMSTLSRIITVLSVITIMILMILIRTDQRTIRATTSPKRKIAPAGGRLFPIFCAHQRTTLAKPTLRSMQRCCRQIAGFAGGHNTSGTTQSKTKLRRCRCRRDMRALEAARACSTEMRMQRGWESQPKLLKQVVPLHNGAEGNATSCRTS